MTPSSAQSGALPVLVIEDEPAVLAYVRGPGTEWVFGDEHRVRSRCLEATRVGTIHGCGFGHADSRAWTAAMLCLALHSPAGIGSPAYLLLAISPMKKPRSRCKTGAPCVEKPFRVKQFISVIEKTMGKAP